MKLSLMLSSGLLSGLNDVERKDFIEKVNKAIKNRFSGVLPEQLGTEVDHVSIGISERTSFGIEGIGKGNHQYVTRLISDTIQTVASDTIWK
jgi:hypothetical protein